ncbi:MAG TPA: membrane-binding protein [Cytophagales bacterium]|nr:membrane-binding protein [Rickettsiales bacterium]HCX25118.1 membrane-binding protein [Cytophagales bacterium]|tara:strand:- start:137 stop:703 length:567 start_codon:yes stop_codon:yes gene_type:complete
MRHDSREENKEDNYFPESIADVYWKSEDVYLDKSTSLWRAKHDSSLINGYVLSYHRKNVLAEKFGVIAGEKFGAQWSYYPDGQPKFLQTYSNNRLNGASKRWDSNQQLLAHLQYKDGKLHGTQKKWYDTGEIHKVMQLNMGVEDGLQQAFRKNGALYANYEARNGRTFGLKRSNLCYEVVDQKINNEE